MSGSGLRERKKLKTRAAIRREAMRLFREQGYHATTIEQIAAAAEISPGTFFNYFRTKEDVFFFEKYDPMLVRLLGSLPSGEPLSSATQRALEGLAEIMERDCHIILDWSQLALGEPNLRARIWEEVDRARDLFAGLIADRIGRDPADFELRLTAMVVVVAVFEGAWEWVRLGGKGSLRESVNSALDVVGAYPRLDVLDKRAR